MAKLISVVNQKGGVGKTTTSINLASFLSKFNQKVLLVDLDSQCNTTVGLGISNKNIQNSYSLIINEIKLNKNYYNYEPISLNYDNFSYLSFVYKTCVEKLMLIPSTPDIVGADVEFSNLSNREFMLKNSLKPYLCLFDFIILDCPPSLGILTINSLVASHSVIIPVQCEFYAMDGLINLQQTINLIKEKLNFQVEIEGILLTMFDNRTNLSKQIETEIRNHFKENVFKTVIPRSTRLAEAPSHSIPVFMYDSRSSGSIAYEELAKEILEKNKRVADTKSINNTEIIYNTIVNLED